MRPLLILIVAPALVLMAGSAHAKTAKAKAPAKSVKAAPGSKLSRNISFSGSTVDGKYHSAGEAVAQVESEKSLNMLMGIRKNFRDRLGDEQARLASGEGTKP